MATTSMSKITTSIRVCKFHSEILGLMLKISLRGVFNLTLNNPFFFFLEFGVSRLMT